MYLARVDGVVHLVKFSTGSWRGWVVQGIFEVIRKICQVKIEGEIIVINEA